jgi:hypothetical protein
MNHYDINIWNNIIISLKSIKMENQQKAPSTAKGRKRNGMLADASQIKELVEVCNEVKSKANESDSRQNTNETSN